MMRTPIFPKTAVSSRYSQSTHGGRVRHCPWMSSRKANSGRLYFNDVTAQNGHSELLQPYFQSRHQQASQPAGGRQVPRRRKETKAVGLRYTNGRGFSAVRLD